MTRTPIPRSVRRDSVSIDVCMSPCIVGAMSTLVSEHSMRPSAAARVAVKNAIGDARCNLIDGVVGRRGDEVAVEAQGVVQVLRRGGQAGDDRFLSSTISSASSVV